MPSGNPCNLLFIDDDPDDGEILEESLKRINPAIKFFQIFDGWDAIMYLKKCPPKELPALIVLDINMRIINGFEFLRVIKGDERLKSIPVMVYSTSANEEDKNLSLTLGAIDYFIKPGTSLKVTVIARIFASFCLQS